MPEERWVYEWENELSKDRVAIQKIELEKAIKRICSVTLRGNFTNPEDRKFWEDRLTKLNGQLIALESM